MTRAKSGDTVKVHYTGKVKDGPTFDSSAERDPVSFIIGEGRVIQGFEDAVVGMAPGEKKTVTIPPEQGYGARKDNMVRVVERTQIPDDIDLELGTMLRASTEQGDELVLTVTDLTDSTVTLDGNHPLAGRDLVFDVELVAIG